MSTFTANLNLEEVARGGDVGTWDTPTNSNWSITDLVVGGIATVSLNNTNVILSAAQFQARQITFNSTLTGSVTITFPTSFTKSYEIQHLCTGSSAFTITLETTAGGQVICASPGETIDVFNDGSNLKFKNLGRIGSYWDYAGSSVPAWVSGCSVPPFLNCDGTAFSSGTYPALAAVLGSTKVPDSRGYARFALGQGTGRLTSGGAGIDGTTIFAQGGNNGVFLGDSEVPSITSINAAQSISVNAASGFVLPITNGSIGQLPATTTGSLEVPFQTGGTWVATTGLFANNSISVAYTNNSQQPVPSTIPAFVGGLTLIRAG